MSWLYSITIYPLELAYKYIYTLCTTLTGSYGLGLIALSICTVVIFTPLKRMASSAQNKERELQDILQPQIQKISSESNGAERHERIAKLYKRYSYHPVMAIRSAFGVALQVPFLMAAYYMISGLTVLQGHSFWFIKDLSQADGLLNGMNLLPIVMTLMNFATTFTSKDMRGKDRVQAMIVALLFLWLLYDAPSALLFYWTCNNISYLLQNLTNILFKHSNFALDIRKTCISSVTEKTFPRPTIQEDKLPVFYSFFSILSLIAVTLEPCLFMYFHNAGEANFIDIVPVSGYFLLGIFTLAVLLYFSFKKNVVKAVFIANMTMLFFLNYAAIEKIVDKMFPSLYYWHIVYIAIVAIAFLAIVTYKYIGSAFTTKANVALLLIFEGSIIVHGVQATPTIYRKLTEQVQGSTLQVATNNEQNKDMPNVYLFIFDEYGGYECLKNYCNYDNMSFYDSLSKLGFSVSLNSYNKTIDTITEIPNLLNLDLVNKTGMLWAQQKARMTNPYLYKLIFEHGYKLSIIDANDFLDTQNSSYRYIPSEIYSEGSAEFYILSKTAYYPFYRFAPTNEIKALNDLFMYAEKSYTFLKDGLFTLAYFPVTHTPWFVDENGNAIAPTNRVNWRNTNAYLGQLKHVNKMIIKLMTKLTKNDPDSIIILLSDHGYRLPTHLKITYGIKNKNLDPHYEKNILCCVYYQNKKIDIDEYCGINTLRTVLNHLLGTKFDMVSW